MPLWLWVLDGVGIAVLLLLVYACLLIARRRYIGRAGGTFEVSHRAGPPPGDDRGWALGVGRYSGDALEFFRVFSMWPGPSVVVRRADLRCAGQRRPAPAEAHGLYAGHVVLDLETDDAGPFEMAMAPDAVTGFLAWLEAAPPGRPPSRS